MDFITEEDQDTNDNVISMNSNLINSNNSNVQFIDKATIEEMKRKKEEEAKEQLRQKEETNKRHQRLFLKKKRLSSLKIKDEKASHKKKKEEKPNKNLIQKEEELKEIKNYYLGIRKKERKKEFRPKENSKDFFVFEWKESEDTLKNAKPLYIPKTDSAILFGRGNLGGIDPKEIKKQSKRYEKLVESYNKEINKQT